MEPGFGFGKAAIEGFGSADMEFSGFGRHGDYGWWGNRRKDEELAWLGNWGGRRWGGDARDGEGVGEGGGEIDYFLRGWVEVKVIIRVVGFNVRGVR